MARTIADALNELVNNDPNGLKPQINKKAPLDSPALTGTPTAPTPAEGDNSKKVATTEFVTNLVSKILSFADEDLNSFVELIDQVKKLRSTKATSTALGMVKIGDNINVADGTISITKGNVVDALGYTPPESATGATLYSGTGTNTDGAMTQKATTDVLDKKLDKTAAATSSSFGAVKIGSNITNTNGTISLTKSNVTSALGYTPPETAGTSVTLASSTGSSTTAGMTQKAITDALNNKANSSDLTNKLDKSTWDNSFTVSSSTISSSSSKIFDVGSAVLTLGYTNTKIASDGTKLRFYSAGKWFDLTASGLS